MGYYPKPGIGRITTPGTSYLWAGTGASISSACGTETFMFRVISQLAGYITVGTTSDPTIASTAGVGTFIAANTASGDYFACTPGQKILFASTTTSSGGVWNVTECS